MTDDFYLIAITALLPLTAIMLVLQVNPYQALVMRGILGAIAALVYALFGAADVALTEALVGTMLSITLYAVAVRSSMEMRLGWVQASEKEAPLAGELDLSAEPHTEAIDADEAKLAQFDETFATTLRKVLKPHHLRLELVPYPSHEALQMALATKRVHTALWSAATYPNDGNQAEPAHRLQTRVKRLHKILSDSLPACFSAVDYLDLVQTGPASVPLAQPSRSRSV